MKNKKLSSLLVIGGMVAGAIGSIGIAAYAQTATPVVQPTVAQTTQASEPQEANEKDHNQVDQVSTEAKATVKMAQAIATAEASAGSKSVRTHIEDENGVISYDVFFADKKIEVDGTTGAITKTEAHSDKGGFFGHHEENDANEAQGTEVEDGE